MSDQKQKLPLFFHCHSCGAEVLEVDDASRTRRVVLDEETTTLLYVDDGKVCGTVRGYTLHVCKGKK